MHKLYEIIYSFGRSYNVEMMNLCEWEMNDVFLKLLFFSKSIFKLLLNSLAEINFIKQDFK